MNIVKKTIHWYAQNWGVPFVLWPVVRYWDGWVLRRVWRSLARLSEQDAAFAHAMAIYAKTCAERADPAGERKDIAETFIEQRISDNIG